MKRVTFTMLLLLQVIVAFAQNGAHIIQGAIFGKNLEPLRGAIVRLYQANEQIQSQISTEYGLFKFSLKDTGVYHLSISFTGFEEYREVIEVSQGIKAKVYENLNIKLIPAMNTLDSVVVVGQRRSYGINNNVLTINPESVIGAQGGTALDLLERAPGINVNRASQQIQIRGKEGILLMMNGRVIQLNAEDIGSFLNSLNANTIASIEVITNPNSSFDANGNAGVIHIKLKQVTDAKLTGRISSTTIYGRRIKLLNSISLSGKIKSLSYFFNVDYNYQPTYTPTHFIRTIPYSGGIKMLDQRIYFDHNNHVIPASLNLEWALNQKVSFSFISNLFRQSNTVQENNSAEYLGLNKIDSALYFYNRTRLNVLRFNNGLSMLVRLDSLGSKLTYSIDYLNVSHRERNDYPGVYSYSNGTQIEKKYRAFYDVQGDIIALRSDYKKVFRNKKSVQAGIKGLFVDVTSLPVFEDYSTVNVVYPRENNISFRYRERVFSAYLNYTSPITKFVEIEAGIRSEFTSSKGTNLESAANVQKNYLDIFPSLMLSYKPGSKYSTTLIMSRRIDRPAYVALNPNIRFRTPLLFVRGNSYLVPQYTNGIELVQRIGKLSIGVGYDQVFNKWQFNQTVLSNSDIAEGITINTEKFNSYYMQFNYTTNIGSALQWVSNTSFTKSITSFNLPDTVFTNNVFGVKFNSTLSYRPKRKWNAELLFQYEGPFIDGIFTYRSRWQINPTIQYAINSRTSLRVTITDPLRTYYSRYFANFRNLITENKVDFETTTIRVNLAIRFGGKNTPSQLGRQADDQFNRL